uniref:ZP domain-containing protein n=1 Tax=Heterorhabditis bacteriophora TaxID=37862 RepID=A0A1I7WS45_HETBA
MHKGKSWMSDSLSIYARCEFQIKFDNNESTVITATSKEEEPQPVVVSRNTQEDRNPFGSSFCYGTDQIVVESVCISMEQCK